MIKFKTYKPIGLDDDKEHWLYAMCMGCLCRLEGIGVELFRQPTHLNLRCIIRCLYMEWKYRTRKQGG